MISQNFILYADILRIFSVKLLLEYYDYSSQAHEALYEHVVNISFQDLRREDFT